MTSFNVSKRLKVIASMIDKNSVVADIGCDHALLDIYLIKNKIVKKAIASDVIIGAINGAKRNINHYKVSNIDIRMGYGLSTISDNDKVDTIILSGLGNRKIIEILKKYDKLNNINNIIIQSNTNVKDIRIALLKLRFYIYDEELVEDKNIIYTVIKFKKGYRRYSNKEICLGPILLNKKGELFNKFLNKNLYNYNSILNKVPKCKILRRIKLYKLIKLIKKEILL